MPEILKLIDLQSVCSFVNLSMIFRLIIYFLTKSKITQFHAGNNNIKYELILFESIFNRAPPLRTYSL